MIKGIRIRKKVGKGKEITREEKEERIDFTRKTYPKRGTASFIMALVSLIGFVVLCAVSVSYKGKGSIAIGIAGFILFVVNVVGILLPLPCFKMKNVAMRSSIMGIAGNGLMAAVYISLYIVGVVV